MGHDVLKKSFKDRYPLDCVNNPVQGFEDLGNISVSHRHLENQLLLSEACVIHFYVTATSFILM